MDAMRLYAASVGFGFGAVLGSFLALAAARVPRGMSVNRPRSFCDTCGRALAWRDLVPVLSWLLLRGRCRYCGARIPARYFLAEVGCGLGLALAALALAGIRPA